MAKKKAVQKKAASTGTPAGQEKGEQASEQASEQGGGAAARPKQKKERPVRCIHRHADVELRRAFPKVCERFLEKAEKESSVPHMRMVLQIAKSGDAKGARGGKKGPSLSEMLLTELKRRQDEREAAMNSDAGAVDPESAAIQTATEGATSEEAEER